MKQCRCRGVVVASLVAVVSSLPHVAAAEPTPRDVEAAMLRAATFYREQVSERGGYVYHYLVDLSRQWGEGEATKDQAWVQPPGTPTVGMAYLAAYRATGNEFYLEAAREAANVLVWGRLSSGGWSNSIDLTGYQQPGVSRNRPRREPVSSLDDGQTQSAIRCLILTDEALEFRDAEIHRAALASLEALLAAQFPNGGFPQVWREPVSPQRVLRAQYPDYDWRTEGRIKEYWNLYTLNDNVCGYVLETLHEAHRVYGDEKYLTAMQRLGDFLVLAQMPDPQPGWAQQYNYAMQPVWARAFEPPGVSGDESQEVIETLLRLHQLTGEQRYLEPIPKALAYLRRSLLPDGQLARYYELRTNRPLYMTRNGKRYELTYDDRNLPSHYGWKTPSRLDELAKRYEAAKAGRPQQTASGPDPREVEQIVKSLDARGRWISTFTGERLVGQMKLPIGTPYLSSDLFCQNLTTLASFLRK